MTAVYQIATAEPGMPTETEVNAWVAAALADDAEEREVVVRVVDAEEGRTLNRTYRGRDTATNVLSFPCEVAPEFGPVPELGDLVICASVVTREAREQGKTLRDHWAHMIVHGTLHLLGYDHGDDDEAAVMEDRERAILAAFGIPDPYAGEADPRKQA
ncbi:MAG: rRNA maturation RNase YbeY [Ectothiorhodospiraceae bacterium]